MSDRVVVTASLRDEIGPGVERVRAQLRRLNQDARTIGASSRGGMFNAATPQQFAMNQRLARFQRTQQQTTDREQQRTQQQNAQRTMRINQLGVRQQQQAARQQQQFGFNHPYMSLGRDLVGEGRFTQVAALGQKVFNGLSAPIKSFIQNLSGGAGGAGGGSGVAGALGAVGIAAVGAGIAVKAVTETISQMAQMAISFSESVITKGLNSGMQLERSRFILDRMDSGNTGLTAQLMNQAIQGANIPGLSLAPLIEQQRVLLGDNVAPAETMKLMQAMIDASSMSDNPSSTLDSLSSAMERIKTNGIVDSRMARVFGPLGIDLPAAILQANNMPLTDINREQIRKRLSQGGAGVRVSEQFLTAFEGQTGVFSKLRGAGKDISQGTLGGLVSTLKNQVNIGLGNSASGAIKSFESSMTGGHPDQFGAKIADLAAKVGKPFFDGLKKFAEDGGVKRFLSHGLPQLIDGFDHLAPLFDIIGKAAALTAGAIDMVIEAFSALYKPVENIVHLIEKGIHIPGTPFHIGGTGVPKPASPAPAAGSTTTTTSSTSSSPSTTVNVHPGAVVIQDHSGQPQKNMQAFEQQLKQWQRNQGERSGKGA